MQKSAPKYRSPLDSDPGVVERILAAHAWLREHSRAVTVGAVGLLLLVAAGLYYLDYRRDLESAAAVELAQVEETVESGNTTLAISDLQRFLAQYGSTRRAREARVMLGRMLIQAGRPREALDAVSQLATQPEDPVAARAALLAGAAYQASGDTIGAIRHYLAIAERLPMDYQRREALASAARLQEMRGDYAGAAATYARLVEIVPEESVERPLYEMRLAEMRARARAEGAQSAANGPGSP
jgi:tetratricopeptide (TPR) repeat protein